MNNQAAKNGQLSPERRKEIAKGAATAMWKKRREEAAVAQKTATARPARPRRARRRSRKPVQDHLAFSAALAAAEKRLPEAIREQSEAAAKYHMCGAEIAGLQNTIYALRNWQRTLSIPGMPGMPPQVNAVPALDPRQVSMPQIMADIPLPVAPPPQEPRQPNQVPKVELPFIPGRAGGGALGPEDLGGQPLADDPDEDEHLRSSAMAGGQWV